jgi:hypothetical protein
LTIILHFGGDIGDKHCRDEISLILTATARSPISAFDNRL